MAPPTPVRATLSLNVRFEDRVAFLEAADALAQMRTIAVISNHRFTTGERVRLTMGYASPTAAVQLPTLINAVELGPSGDCTLHLSLLPNNTADQELLRKLVVEARATRTVRFLLAEDNPHIRQMYSRALHHSFDDGEASASVMYAADGLEAWQLIERHGPPDLMVCDLAMPVMDGLALISKVREDPRSKTLPVLVITAGDELALEHAATLGIQGRLHKPVQLTHIVAEVRRILGMKPKDA